MPRLPMPDFLGIGAMRSGTSWFAAHLARHPAIRIGRKEIHFFDRKLERRRFPFLPSDAEARLRYGLRFAPAALTGRLAGEFTPAYAILDPERLATVHDWMPDVKILYIMRDPVERAWSQTQHDYRIFLGRDAAEAPRDELLDHFERPSVRRRGDYATCLENWMRFFERERFFLTFLEDVREDPERVLRETFAFLGVRPDVEPAVELFARVHASAGAPMPDWARRHLEATLRPGDARLASLLGRPLPWSRIRRGRAPE